jgi:hypothetical protein
MKNAGKVLIVVFIALLSGACSNYFHDLIPPDDNRILFFEVDGQIGDAVISNNTVSVFVEKGTDINSAVPRISISNKAVLLPVTFEYVMSAFPSADLFDTAMKMGGRAGGDITSFVMDMIRDNPDFNIPAIDMPIDFSGPVTMLVVSGQGSIRQYTVELTVDTGEPRLLNFSFSKYDNAELVIDARCTINEADRTVTANALYPIEMDYLSFKLVPSFQIHGESLSLDGVQILSGITEAQFTPLFGSQNKTIRVTRNGEIKDYTLTIIFAEDPDTVRSITDFRFNKVENQEIAANAVASIINTDNTGTIIVQVFYSGAKTPMLTPRFISPGRVSVGGVVQTSGISGHDFSSPMEYRVVSKNGLYTRTYTVKVEFISLKDGAPRITAFRFSAAFNLELVQDAVGEISDGIIMVEVRYGGTYPPISLIPEFSAEGLVSVYGSVQVSGASPQDFVRQIKYTVTNPINPLFTRDYWVQCHMIRDTSSEAVITSFGFYPEDNTSLADEVIGKIDQINKKITVYAPVGSGITSRTMFPRFTAAGQVNVGETGQVSGVSGRIFDAPVTYTVVSANGKNSKSYSVIVRELQTTIYVDSYAFGHGDGLNWENAFRSLKQACEAAAQFPEDTPKEIWIASGTYKPGSTSNDYFPLSANTSYIGGFAGHETAKSQRNVAANPVIISGDIGAGTYSARLFSSVHALGGDLLFDSLRFTSTSGTANGGGIYAALGSHGVLNVTNCTFDNLKASDSGGAVYVRGGGADISNSSFNLCNGGAVFVQGTTAEIKDTKFTMCKGADVLRLDCSGETAITRVIAEDSSGLNFSGNGNKTLETVSVKRGEGVGVLNSEGNLRITDSDLTDISGTGVSIDNLSGNAEIIGLNLRNITGYGIYGFNSSPGRVRLSGITANAISSSRAVNMFLTYGAIFIENSNFTSRGIYLKTGSSSLVDVSGTNITSVTNGDAITIDGGNNVTVENVKIDGVPYGRGLYMNGLSGNAEVISLDLRDISNNYGVYCAGSPNRVQLSGITANNVRDSRVVNLSLTKGAIILENSTFTNIAGISLSTGSSSPVEVNKCGINTVTSGNALTIVGGNNAIIDRVNINGVTSGDAINVGTTNTAINQVTIDGVPNGRGINITNNGNTDISNTEIKNCVIIGNGGGININGTGNATISIVTITACKASSMGGGMYFSGSGNVTVYRATIDNITGGGIGRYSGNLYIENSKIKNITGNGIECSDSMNFEVSSLELQNISSNGIFCSANKTMYFSGITASDIGSGKTSGISSISSTSGNFTVKNSKFTSCDVSYSTSASASGPFSIHISDTEILNARGLNGFHCSTGNGTITIDHFTIDGVPNGRGINITNNGNTDISNTEIKNCVTTGNGGGIYITGSGNIEINGSTISGNKSDNGGGLYINVNSGNINMNGNTIYGNTSIDGGGLYINVNSGNSGNINMHGNTISGNTSNYGGGFYINVYSGNIIMNGNTISGNTSNYGGGLLLNRGGDLVMNSGTISNNSVLRSGGGVRIDSGTFTMNGGTIANNTSKGEAGGVAVVFRDCKFIMRSGAVISGNSVISDNDTYYMYGGGVFANGGTFIMEGGTISGNSIIRTSGTKYVWGGGVCVSNGTIIMSDGIISGNYSSQNGGGLFVQTSSSYTKTGGTIYGSDGGANANYAGNNGHAAVIFNTNINTTF